MVVADLDESRQLRLGPDRAGNLLEIVMLELDDTTAAVIHNMRMRPRYRGRLQGHEASDA